MRYFPHPQPASTTPPSSKQEVTRASEVWKGRPGHALGEVSRWGGGAVSLAAAVAPVIPVGAWILGFGLCNQMGGGFIQFWFWFRFDF